MKNDKLYYFLMAIIALIPLSILAFLWSKIPQNVPIHFDISGKVDRWGNKSELIFLMLFLSIISILVSLLVQNDPKKDNQQLNKNNIRKILMCIALFLAVVQFDIISSALSSGTTFNSNLLISSVFFLFAFIGNFSQNLRPNYWVGIRTPWTLENEEVWRQTHRICSKFMFWGGIGGGILSFFLPSEWSVIILLLGVTILVLGVFFLSYSIHKKVVK